MHTKRKNKNIFVSTSKFVVKSGLMKCIFDYIRLNINSTKAHFSRVTFSASNVHRNAFRFLGFEKYSVLGWSDGGISGLILASLAPEAVDNLVVWGSNSYVAKEDQDMVNGLKDMSKWSDKMKLPLESKLYIIFLNSLVF